jgi:hypothetical protein
VLNPRADRAISALSAAMSACVALRRLGICSKV